MTLPFRLIRKQVACCLVLLSAIPIAQAAPTPLPESVAAQESQSTGANDGQAQNADRTQAPSSNVSRPEAAQSTGQKPESAQNAGKSDTSNSPQASTSQQENGAPQPVGTAAAPSERTLGVAASRPAGAVIAPAKQRRARSFLIKVGVIVGACVAVGTVAALSRSSSSTPH